MLEAVALDRERDVYVMNMVKCRPPGNRNPEADEIAACRPFLQAQLATVRPSVILALGSVATQALLGTKEPIGRLRGRVHQYGGLVLIPTFHPAFLLRNPGQEYKKMAWDDLKLARREFDARRRSPATAGRSK
jgi:DNA polymerase